MTEQLKTQPSLSEAEVDMLIDLINKVNSSKELDTINRLLKFRHFYLRGLKSAIADGETKEQWDKEIAEFAAEIPLEDQTGYSLRQELVNPPTVESEELDMMRNLLNMGMEELTRQVKMAGGTDEEIEEATIKAEDQALANPNMGPEMKLLIQERVDKRVKKQQPVGSEG